MTLGIVGGVTADADEVKIDLLISERKT